ncbi:MAG: hypothetical protein QOE90_2854 [Thermoplasmata archaeon]|jgi:hypothetical protein|nr:hypothetical protein [Thermoplasmata archaeon]
MALALVALLLAGCADLPQLGGGLPPPQAVALADVLNGTEGARVATEPLTVVAIHNATAKAGQGTWKVPSLVTLADAQGREIGMLLDTANATQHRKQLGVPLVGMRVQAQGTFARNATGAPLLKNVTRWAPLDHEGATVPAELVAAGAIAEGTYVWLQPAVVHQTRHESDGDTHVELTIPGGRLVTEETPPFGNALAPPSAGDTVEVYGMVLFDATHGWWEVHPVQCWSRGSCAPPLDNVADITAGED